MFGKKAQTPPQPETPAVPKAADLGAVIHVMPKAFYGKAAALKEPPKPPAPIAPPPPPAAPKAPTPMPPLPKRSRLSPLLLIAGALFVLALGGVAFVLLRAPELTPVVSPEPVPEPEPQPEVEPEPEPVPEPPQPGKDSDSDGLTDVEELLYGTDFRNPDTDGDTFLDGNEVFHRYDPNGLAPSTLLDTGSVKQFAQGGVGYTMLYPASWRVVSENGTDVVTFKTPSSAAITVVRSTKSEELMVEDWVLANVDDVLLDDLEPTYTKTGYYTVRASGNELTTYLDAGLEVYVVTYALNLAIEIAYLQTYEMMVNSFVLDP